MSKLMLDNILPEELSESYIIRRLSQYKVRTVGFLGITTYEKEGVIEISLELKDRNYIIQRAIMLDNSSLLYSAGAILATDSLITDGITEDKYWVCSDVNEILWDLKGSKQIKDEKLLKMHRKAYSIAFRDEMHIEFNNRDALVARVEEQNRQIRQENLRLLRHYKNETVKHLKPIKTENLWVDFYKIRVNPVTYPFFSQGCLDEYKPEDDIKNIKSYLYNVNDKTTWTHKEKNKVELWSFTKHLENTISNKEIAEGIVNGLYIRAGMIPFIQDGEATTLLALSRWDSKFRNVDTGQTINVGFIVSKHETINNVVQPPYKSKYFGLNELPEVYRLLALSILMYEQPEDIWGFKAIKYIVTDYHKLRWSHVTDLDGNIIRFEVHGDKGTWLNNAKYFHEDIRTLGYMFEKKNYEVISIDKDNFSVFTWEGLE